MVVLEYLRVSVLTHECGPVPYIVEAGTLRLLADWLGQRQVPPVNGGASLECRQIPPLPVTHPGSRRRGFSKRTGASPPSLALGGCGFVA